jgi:hypothetical protein
MRPTPAAAPPVRARSPISSRARDDGGSRHIVFSWFFRFNDPNGGFAGLTDGHFFYLLRGWQILSCSTSLSRARFGAGAGMPAAISVIEVQQ